MARAFVSIGSNVDPEQNVLAAVRRLKEHVKVRAVSTVYLTEPVGPAGQLPYYNCVLGIETDRSPLDLKLAVLRTVEGTLGRKRTADKFAPRTIDLDLLLYDDIVMETADLVLPDPDILKRPYLAISLRELAPDLVLPGTGETIEHAAAQLPPQTMRPLEQYTNLVRKEILHEREP